MSDYIRFLQHIKIVTIQWKKDWRGWKFVNNMPQGVYFETVFRSITVDFSCQKSSMQMLFSWNGCLGLPPANERRRYFVTTSLIGWAQA